MPVGMEPKEFLRKFSRRIKHREWLYATRDNNQMTMEDWHNSDVRVLHAFLSAGPTRAVSMTGIALQNLIIQQCPGTFLDFSYFPMSEDINVWKNAGAPIWFGNVTHQPASEYDLLFITQAVLGERFNVPIALKSSGIPLDHWERLEREDIPLVITGGIAATHSESLTGKFTDPTTGKSGECLIDLVYMGQAEGRLPEIIQSYRECREAGMDKKQTIYTLVTMYDNLYYPMGYEVTYDGASIVSNEKREEWLPDQITVYGTDVVSGPNMERKTINNDGSCTESVDLLISQGCSGAGSCSFCAEGWQAGAWREAPLEDLVEHMKSSRMHAAPNQVSFYSFNANYYSKFLDLLGKAAEVCGQLSMITMRADEIAFNPDILRLSRLFGVKRISLAVEGLGETLRNVFLNKNLPWSTFRNTAKVAFQLRMIEIKLPYIITGYETKEFIDEGIEEIMDLVRLRDEMGAKTNIRINMTPLVIYDHTPLRSYERVTARNNILDNVTMGYFLRRMGEIPGVRVKFHTRGYGPFVDQMFLDGGRLITNDIVQANLGDNVEFTANWTPSIFQKFIDRMKQHDLKTLLGARPEGWIYPDTRTVIRLQGALEEAEQNLMKGEPTNYCLDTLANPRPKCHKRHGCTFCPTVDLQKAKLIRNLENRTTVADIQKTLADNKARQRIRVLARKKPGFDYVSPTAGAVMITSRILQTYPLWEPTWHSVDVANSGFWAERNKAKNWTDGVFVFDILMRQKVSVLELSTVKDYVNTKLDSVEIVGVSEVLDEKDRIHKTDLALYSFHITESPGQIASRLETWGRDILVARKSRGPMLTKRVPDDRLTRPSIYPAQRGGTAGAFVLPLEFNPYFYLAAIMGWPLWRTLENSRVETILVGYKGDSVCSCGAESTIINRADSTAVPMGFDCLKARAGTLRSQQ